MLRLKKSIFGLAIVAAIVSLGACNNKENDPKENAEERNEASLGDKAAEEDAQFMVDAYSSSLMEVRASEQAVQMATMQEVKDIAGTMQTAHTSMNAQLQALAARKNISLPTDLTQDQKDKMNRMSQKTGRDYDEKYVEELIDEHKSAIRLFEKASAQAEDADIKAVFVNGLPELRHHLDMATALQDRMKD